LDYFDGAINNFYDYSTKITSDRDASLPDFSKVKPGDIVGFWDDFDYKYVHWAIVSSVESNTLEAGSENNTSIIHAYFDKYYPQSCKVIETNLDRVSSSYDYDVFRLK
jgi:hypothetical protein